MASHSSDGDLKALEGLMGEFFSPRATNERKREIEVMLDNFSRQKDAWRRCLEFMAATQSHYVCMFALNTLEVGTSAGGLIVYASWSF